MPTKPTAAEKRAARKHARERFLRSRKAGKVFERQLKAVAKQVGRIVEGMAPKGVVQNVSELQQLLNRYGEILKPWAKMVAMQMVAEVGQRDETSWIEMGREIGRALRKEIETAPTGRAMRELIEEQTDLITSLPIEAGLRIQKLTIQNLYTSTRSSELAKEIMRTEHVTTSRAKLIARTETARTASILTQVRAEHIGSLGYIWRTVGDSDVREMHKHLEGTYVAWDDPPVAGSNDERAHAGQLYNCRCWGEPVIPDIIT